LREFSASKKGKTLANPKPTRVGNGGSRELRPLAGGMGGVPPQIQKRERVAHPCNPATSGTQNPGKPSARGVGKWGVQGAQAPMAGGLGGVPPQIQKRERVAHISNPAASGT